MYSQTDINDAVAGGALTEEQANSLRSFIATRNGAPTSDEEHVRLLLGFNDIFVSIACVFALIAVAWLGSLIPLGGGGGFGRMLPVQAPFAALFVAAASWGLAMIFTKKRHTAFPSILLAVGFIGGVAAFLILLLASTGGFRGGTGPILAFVGLAAGAGAAVLHWKFFRVPVAIALGALMAIMAVVTLTLSGMNGPEGLMVILLIAGLGIFLWAMWWDSQDPLRYGEKSDVAFWLHWLAGGLIVNALATLFGVSQRVDSIGGAIGILVIYALLVLVALAVNRKVYLLAGPQPFISALQNLVGGGGSNYDYYDRYGSSPYSSNPYGSPYSSYPRSYSGSTSTETQMITLLIIAILFVLLAIYWAPVRRAVVGMLPAGLRAKLPATGAEATEQANTFN
jgi:hypothetical protein